MTYTFLGVLILHALCGALWVGAAVLAALFLTPAARDLGPDGMKMMLALRKRGFIASMPVIAVLTVLSGIRLYWRFTAGFSQEVTRSHTGMAYGLGGASGLLAAIIGGAVLSRAIAQAMKLGAEAASLPEGPDRAQRLAKATALRQRAATAGQVVMVLVIIAISLMVIARYLGWNHDPTRPRAAACHPDACPARRRP